MTRNRSILFCICIIAAILIAWPNWPTASSQTTPGQTPKSSEVKPRRPAASPTPRPRRPVRPTRPAANTAAEELLFWDTIKESKDPADFNAYLTRFGESGKFAVLAHNRLNAIAAERRAAGTGPGTGPVTNRVPATPGSTTRSNTAIEFVAIAPASFTMGSPENEAGRDSDEGPQRVVTFSRGFGIGKYEITQGQWRNLMGTNPSKFGNCDDCPVEMVSWDDAQAFIAKLNSRNDGFRYSLPTEAQFEYVMRGGTTGIFAGNANALGDLGWYKPNSGDRTHPAGQKRPNAYGVYDIHGNVQEWVQDVYTSDYDGAPTDGSARSIGPEPIKRVIRGGSWEDLEKYYRSAFRVARGPDDRNEYTGFRIVKMPASGGGAAPAAFPTFEFAAIAPGTFMMGSPEGESERDNDEGPRHQVTIARGFYAGKYEITQAQWRAVMGTDPSKFSGCDQCPVEMVSWDDAQQFIAKLNARNDGFRYSLPTEAQWEYLMRGGTTGAFASTNLDRLGWYLPNSDRRTHPVGQKGPNSFGLYDIHGNVQEWVQDVYAGDYVSAPADGSARTLGRTPITRVIRGGSYEDAQKYFRSAFRITHPPDNRNPYTGFRLVRMPVR